MRLQYGLSVFERARGDLPALPVINMFAEKAPTVDTGVILQSRPGMEAVSSIGSVVQAIFQKDGVLNGSQYTIVDTKLYENGILVGSVNGSGPFSIDGYADQIFIAGGADIWGYDGATLAVVSFPDSAYVVKVITGASRAVAVRYNTQTYYFSGVLNATFDALSYISAESQPDLLLDALFIDDMLVLFGRETTEFHQNTGDANAPFSPIQGRVYPRGIKKTGACAKIGSTFAWVTDANNVCMTSHENIISNEGIEEKIAASTACRLWTFFIDATEFLALTLDTETYVMTPRAGTWHEFASNGETNWLPVCYANGVFGTSDGRIVQWTSAHADFNGVLERTFRAGAPLDSIGIPVDNIILRTNPGQTPYSSGDYATPEVKMRLSKDGGETWGAWKTRSLGEAGEYRKKIQWVGLGLADQPGLLAEFTVTDPVPFRISDVRMNENFGGR